MSKVVLVKADRKFGKVVSKVPTVSEKRVRDAASGQFLTMRTLDGQSETFGSDLTYVFTKNVSKARRENKRVTGVVDRDPAKI